MEYALQHTGVWAEICFTRKLVFRTPVGGDAAPLCFRREEILLMDLSRIQYVVIVYMGKTARSTMYSDISICRESPKWDEINGIF